MIGLSQGSVSLVLTSQIAGYCECLPVNVSDVGWRKGESRGQLIGAFYKLSRTELHLSFPKMQTRFHVLCKPPPPQGIRLTVSVK